MAAADDYPILASWSAAASSEPTRSAVQCRAALAEIDQLRILRDFHNEILDDVLPILVLRTNRNVITKLDGRWTLVKVEPEEPT